MQVDPQPVYGPDGKRVARCEAPRHQRTPSTVVAPGNPGGFPTQGLPVALVAMLSVVAVLALRRRGVLVARPA